MGLKKDSLRENWRRSWENHKLRNPLILLSTLICLYFPFKYGCSSDCDNDLALENNTRVAELSNKVCFRGLIEGKNGTKLSVELPKDSLGSLIYCYDDPRNKRFHEEFEEGMVVLGDTPELNPDGSYYRARPREREYNSLPEGGKTIPYMGFEPTNERNFMDKSFGHKAYHGPFLRARSRNGATMHVI